MSGIIGVITKKQNSADKRLSAMYELATKKESDELTHFVNEKGSCGFGHWRNKSQQDQGVVTAKDQAFTLVFSGSIYNEEEIKKSLTEEGVDCSGFSVEDTVLNAFLIWGNEVPNKLNGEFVFAIWDEEKAAISLFRDRLGLKSLYYYPTVDAFYFSTRLKALEAFIDKSNWSEPALQYYFRLGYIPAPFSIYKGVKKLEEGSFLEINFDTFFSFSDDLMDNQPKKYWKLEEKVMKQTISNENEAKKELHDLLKSSVQMRMQGETSFGCLLSGGVDSSLITAVAQSLSETPVSTFSIGFKEASHNESHYAKEVADLLGTNHHEFILSHKEAQELIKKIPDWYEQPYADSSALPTYLVSKMAKQKVDKVLTGDGGDEQFMGYGMYTWADRLTTLRNSKTLFKTLLKLSPKNNHKRVSRYFDFSDKDYVPSHIFSVDQGFFTAKGLHTNFHFTEKYSSLQVGKTARKLLVSEQQALFDLKYYLPGDLAEKVDRVALELDLLTTGPLLDYRIVEWSLNLNESLKRKGEESKYLLKQVLYDYLPASLFQRPKWGFGIPLGAWLANELKPLLDEYVNEEKLNQYPFYNTQEILKIKQEFLQGKTYLYQQLWLVIMFNMWAEGV